MRDQMKGAAITSGWSAIGGALAFFAFFLFQKRLETYAGQEFPDGAPAIAGTVMTAGLAFVGPIFLALRDKLMRIIGAIVAVVIVGGAAPAEAADLARIVLTEKVVEVDHEQFDPDTGDSLGYSLTHTSSVAEMYFAPMVSVRMLVVNLERRADYRAGVVPGVGYAFHYSPEWYDAEGDGPFLSLGVFLEGGLSIDGDGPNYATFMVLPAVTLLSWFSVGVGWEQRLALDEGVDDDGAAVLAIGIASAF